ncbi:MAG: histidine kinase [Taibaiella sp.]|nr:histidine kinase [Taibaiella sp.]
MLILDKSIGDDRLSLSLEQRISDLEQERMLQYQIIQSKNRFNSALLVSIAIMFILVFSIFRSLHAIKRKNKKIALQSLRKEMNPHFIFNSLNSVNQFIAENNELEANKFLTSYSGLMRNIMEHSNKDFVKLSIEIEQLKKYLALEHLRFRDKFDYYIIVDEGLDPDATLIPNMLIQPQLENAIWHGLRYKEGKGRLSLQFLTEDHHLIVKVVDDGIGIAQSQQMKTRHQRTYASIGLQNTKQRIELLNQLYKKDMRLNILSDDHGTTIYFDFGRLKYKTEKQ